MQCLFLACLLAGAAWPLTTPERTQYQRTSTYDEVMAFLGDLRAQSPSVSLEAIGKSTRGRSIPLLICSTPPVSGQAEARRQGRLVVYIQANIHGGEVEGKEAAQMLVRDYLRGRSPLLDKIVLLVCPIFNIDGNEDFDDSSRNRPGQNGPASVGRRTNGQGLDLNRDCMKAEAPETQAVLSQVYARWQPDVVIDLHTTDGTRHGYHLTYAPALHPATSPGILGFSRDRMMPAIEKSLLEGLKIRVFPYGNVGRREAATWTTFGFEGRYVTNYAGLRGAVGILSEATTYYPFRQRIETTYAFVDACLKYLLAHAREVAAATKEARRGLAPGTRLPLRGELASRGVEPVLLERLAAAGEPRRTGIPTDLEEVRMPVRDRFSGAGIVSAPAAYLIPPGENGVVALLRRHGIALEHPSGSWTGAVQEFQASAVGEAPFDFQGHRLRTLEGKFVEARATVDSRWWVARTKQPLGLLAAQILEPESPDGAWAWGMVRASLRAGSRYPILKAMSVKGLRVGARMLRDNWQGAANLVAP